MEITGFQIGIGTLGLCSSGIDVDSRPGDDFPHIFIVKGFA
jgi:hypothetical protein